MSITYKRTISPQALDRDGVCQAQTRGSAGALTINGALATGFSVASRVSIYSTGTLSSVTCTIVGVDRYGTALTESRAGPNNTTVVTSANFLSVSSVTVSAAVGTNVEVGLAGQMDSPWVPLDYKTGSFTAALAVALSSGASLTYAIEYTNDLVLKVGEQGVTKVWQSPVQGSTVDDEVALVSPAAAVRVAVTNYVSGTLDFTVLQSVN